MAEQELDRHGRRELGGAAEAAALVVEGAAERDQGLVQVGVGGRVGGGGGVDRGPFGQLGPDPAGHLADLLAAVPPGGGDALQHLPEGGHAVPGLGREVGAEVERLLVRREEHRHRPATLPGGGLHGLHVHGVDVRPLLAVDLDGDVVLVGVRRHRLVLEGLVGHHVAPVARRVPDTQQHRHPAPARLLEGLGRPLPPVDGVVGVLLEIRRGRVRQPVHAHQSGTRARETHTRHPEAPSSPSGKRLGRPCGSRVHPLPATWSH